MPTIHYWTQILEGDMMQGSHLDFHILVQKEAQVEPVLKKSSMVLVNYFASPNPISFV